MSNPRSSRPLAAGSPASARCDLGELGGDELGRGRRRRIERPRLQAAGRRSSAGRCRRSAGPARSPRKTTRSRWPFSWWNSTPWTAAESRATTRRASSSEIRPARLSTTLPSASSVHRFPRAATSPGRSSTSRPAALSTPRPSTNSSGSYPNSARCPGPEPGVIPGPTGSRRPVTPSLGQAVEVRRDRLFQLGAVREVRHPAQAVDHDQEDPRPGAGGERSEIHPGDATPDRPLHPGDGRAGRHRCRGVAGLPALEAPEDGDQPEQDRAGGKEPQRPLEPPPCRRVLLASEPERPEQRGGQEERRHVPEEERHDPRVHDDREPPRVARAGAIGRASA